MNLDVRYIKGDHARAIVTPVSWNGVKPLCEHCAAVSFCGVPNKSDVNRCSYPILPLTFQDDTGLHLPEFSTIRLGTAWRIRLNAGRGGLVALYYKRKDKSRFLGYAKVTSAITSEKADALERSYDNHMVLGKDMSKDDIINYLDALLTRYYDGFDQRHDKPYTTIDLERLDKDESARLQTAWPVDEFHGNYTAGEV